MTSATDRLPLAGAEQGAGTVAGRLGAAWRDFRAYRATIAALEALSDRQLADSGLSRRVIRQTARGAVYGISR